MNKNKRYYSIVYLIIGIFILILCTDKKKSAECVNEIVDIDDMFNSFKKEIDVKVEVFLNDTVQLRKPFLFKICKDYIIIYDKDDSTFYSVYDMQKKVFICRFLRRGRGPDEYLQPSINNFGEDSIMVVDKMSSSNIAIYSIGKIIKGDNLPDRIIKLEKADEGDVIKTCFFFNNSLLVTGQFIRGRYHIFNLNGGIQKIFGSYPTVNSKVDYDNLHLGYIFGSSETIQSNSQYSKIACITKSALTIFNYDNKVDSFNRTFNLKWYTPEIMEATYKNGKPYVLRRGNGAKIGAGNLAANDKYLFFPFSKYEVQEIIKQGVHDYYGYIFVTDWNGNPLARLKLDKRIHFPLEIDVKGTHLYSTHVDPKSGFAQIVKIDIKVLNDL